MKSTLALVLCVVALVPGQAMGRSVDGAVASVRQYPSFTHKCTASFIKSNTLVSVASCFLCSGKCQFYVAFNKFRLPNREEEVYEVKQFMFYPDFFQNFDNNIAIIRLNRGVPDVETYALPPSGASLNGLKGAVFSYLFNPNVKHYSLKSFNVKSITNEICSYYFVEFISRKYMCLKATEQLFFGPADRGSPAVLDLDGRQTLFGILTKPGVVNGEEVVKYLSIFPFLDFIRSAIA